LLIFGVVAAYTMFNVFLPKLLETEREGNKVALKETLWGIVIYTLGGCPGAIVSRMRCVCVWFVDARMYAGRCVVGRNADGEAVVAGWEHVFDCCVVWGVCACEVAAGGAVEHGGDKFNFNGELNFIVCVCCY
jgi:hypothetical protein